LILKEEKKDMHVILVNARNKNAGQTRKIISLLVALNYLFFTLRAVGISHHKRSETYQVQRKLHGAKSLLKQ